jgi:hypothetical protein
MSGAAAMTERKPERDKNGLPWCTREDCPQYDGKRCREMGFRPDRFCEPQLIDDYAARGHVGGGSVSHSGIETAAECCEASDLGED